MVLGGDPALECSSLQDGSGLKFSKTLVLSIPWTGPEPVRSEL